MARRLAAILAAGVAGYSRMMSENEAGTRAALRLHRSEIIIPAIARHDDRVVKPMGDGILAEFAGVVEAAACAAEAQRAMVGRSMSFRIGVHIGDVVVEGDNIYGDGSQHRSPARRHR